MIYVRTVRAEKNAAGIALKGAVHTDRSRNRPMVINGLFDGLRVFASYIGPGIDFLVMRMGRVAGRLPGHIGEIDLIDRPCVGLT